MQPLWAQEASFKNIKIITDPKHLNCTVCVGIETDFQNKPELYFTTVSPIQTETD